MAKCDFCDGWGRFDDVPCSRCDGTGEQPETKAPEKCPHCGGPILNFEGELECVSCGKDPNESEDELNS